MSRFLFLLSGLPSIFCPTCSICEYFDNAIILKTYCDGVQIEMSNQDLRKFNLLFDDAIENAREMPAYCVSLHEETVEALQSGIWARFIFPSTQIHNNMQFNELLLKIEKDMSGVNIIRSNFGFLEGRCYYLDLEKNFNELYEFLSGLKTIDINGSLDNPFEDDELSNEENSKEENEDGSKEEVTDNEIEEENTGNETDGDINEEEINQVKEEDLQEIENQDQQNEKEE